MTGKPCKWLIIMKQLHYLKGVSFVPDWGMQWQFGPIEPFGKVLAAPVSEWVWDVGDPATWAAYWIYFPSSERWKSLEKLPLYPYHPFCPIALAVKGAQNHPWRMEWRALNAPSRVPPFRSVLAWEVTRDDLAKQPLCDFPTSRNVNSLGWAHSEVVLSSCKRQKSIWRYLERKGLASPGSPIWCMG